MQGIYYAVVFAGRVLHVDLMPGSANDWRTDWLKENERDPKSIRVVPLAYPPQPYTAAKTFDWINRLLDGTALDTIAIDQEIA